MADAAVSSVALTHTANTIDTSQFVDATALADLFQLFAQHISCVILNACYSEVQATAIAQHIPHVIGMNQAIGDRAALEFAIGFYDALGAGQTIEFAYKLGCSTIRMVGIPEQLTPTLTSRSIPANTAPTPPHPQPVPVTVPTFPPAQKRRLAQQRATLQTEWELRSEKINHLRHSLVIESGAAIQFQLQKQIQEEEEEEEALTTLDGTASRSTQSLSIERDLGDKILNPRPNFNRDRSSLFNTIKSTNFIAKK